LLALLVWSITPALRAMLVPAFSWPGTLPAPPLPAGLLLPSPSRIESIPADVLVRAAYRSRQPPPQVDRPTRGVEGRYRLVQQPPGDRAGVEYLYHRLHVFSKFLQI